MIIMHLADEYFDLIKSGEKIFEIRINDEKRQKIEVGDTILFKRQSNSLDGLVVKIIERRQFNSFKEMISRLDFNDIGMSGKDPEEVLQLYQSFYSKDEEEKYGVVAFKLQLM